MLGYYTAKQEQRKGLEDIALKDLDFLYRMELAKRAERETRHLVRLRDRASVVGDNSKVTDWKW